MKSKVIDELLSDPTPATSDAVDPAIPVDKWRDRREGDFYIKDGRHGFMRKTREASDIETPLTFNFAALIDQELILDDGLNTEVAFEISAKRQFGGELPKVTIPATQFHSMNWLAKHYGARAITVPDQAAQRRLATNIMVLSGEIPMTTIYTHTGWRSLNGQWHYLSGSGAINTKGLDETVRVELGAGHIQHYVLPAPHDNQQINVDALLGFLTIAPNNRGVGAAIFCSIVRSVLGECLPIDFSILLVGQTGAFKSETAALALGCFGDFNARRFTANFVDSEGDLERKAHQAKDAIFVVDDFKAGSSIAETNKNNAKFDYISRGAGNQAGRGKLNSDSTGKAARHPRGMIIVTGEMTPAGGSLLGRLLVGELKIGDIPRSVLSSMIDFRDKGEFTAVMADFIQWLAPRMAELKKTYPGMVKKARDQALDDRDEFAKSHPRAGDIYAQLYAAADIFIEFAHDVGAINALRSERLMEEIDTALRLVMQAQHQYQKASDEVERFVALLRGSFASGECHVCSHLNQGPPISKPHMWGWRAAEVGGEKIGRGQMIGWINEIDGQIWAEPEALFKTVQKFASSQNDPILMNKSTLWKRLLERGLLAKFDTDKNGIKRPDAKQTIDGGRKRVLFFHVDLITQPDKEAAKPEPRWECTND